MTVSQYIEDVHHSKLVNLVLKHMGLKIQN